MKPKRTKTILLILLLLLLSACGRGQEGDELPVLEYLTTAESDAYPAQAETPGPLPLPTPVPILSIPAPTPAPRLLNDVFQSGNTRAQYLEDLDYLYEVLKANFPHINALYRARGVDLHELFANARYTLENAHHHRNLNAILREEIFNHVNGFGHMAILERGHLRFLLPFRAGYDEFEPFVDVVDNPATRRFYNLTDADFEPRVQEDLLQDQDIAQHQRGNVETRIIEEGRIAYVRIYQMSATTKQGDYIQLIEFYESIADYEHLIVDIRGNTGGDARFFPDLVIAPNISEALYYNFFMFFMAGEHNMRFLEPLIELGWLQVDPVHPGIFEELSYFNPADIEGLDYYIRIVSQVNPSRDEAIFGGKVWLLIDESNFSASGDAVEIVNETGFATLVGNPTGSSGTGINPTVVALPNSGIVMQYSTMNGTNFTGRNGYEYGTQPHVLCSYQSLPC